MTRNTTCLPSVTSDSSHPPPERPLDRPRPAPSPASGTAPRPTPATAPSIARAKENGRVRVRGAASSPPPRSVGLWGRWLGPSPSSADVVGRGTAESGGAEPRTGGGGGVGVGDPRRWGRAVRGTGVRPLGRRAAKLGAVEELVGSVPRRVSPLPRWDAGRRSPAVPSRAEAGEWGSATHEGGVGRRCGEPEPWVRGPRARARAPSRSRRNPRGSRESGARPSSPPR